MKKLLNISIAVILGLSIVLGYTGITVYKMVCATENGKVLVSVTDLRDDCQHNKPSGEDNCCKPQSKKQTAQQEEKDACCDYSINQQKIDDETLVKQQQNSCNHYLKTILLSWFDGCFLTVAPSGEVVVKTSPPPLLSLKKQPFQSYTQSYLI